MDILSPIVVRAAEMASKCQITVTSRSRHGHVTVMA